MLGEHMKLVTIVKLQWLLTWRSPDQLIGVVVLPLSTIIAGAIIDSNGRADLLYYSLVAISLMTIIQTGFMTAAELMVNDRVSGVLESMIVTTSSYLTILAVRVLIVTAVGMLGCSISWLILVVSFDVILVPYHPWVALITLIATTLATAWASFFLAALICRARSARAVQNSLAAPVFLLAGVLVPVGFLSPWLELPGRVLYVFWAAELLRDSFIASEPRDVVLRLYMLFTTGFMWAILGIVLLRRMLSRLRRDGALHG